MNKNELETRKEQLEELSQKMDELLEKFDMTPVEIEHFLGDSSNFDEDLFENIQKQKLLLDELLEDNKLPSSPLKNECQSWFKV